MQPDEHLPDPATDSEATLALYLAGALPEEERMAFERHLAGCPRCLDQAVELGSVTSALGRFSDDDIAAILALDASAEGATTRGTPVPAAVRPPGARSLSRPESARADSSRPRTQRVLRRYLAYTGGIVALLALAGLGFLLVHDSGSQPATAEVAASAQASRGEVSLSVSVIDNAPGSTVDAQVTGLQSGVRYRLYAVTGDGVTYAVRDWFGDSSTQNVRGDLAVPVDALAFFSVGAVDGGRLVTAPIERPTPQAS
jgi:hypothetical protein